MDAPAVAVTRDGRMRAVAWMATPEGSKGRDVFWATAQAGAGFAGDAALQADNGGTQGHPALAVDAGGTFHAAWEDEGDGPSRIRMRSSGKGAKEMVASDPDGGPATFPSIVAMKDGVVVAWEQGGGIRFRRFP